MRLLTLIASSCGPKPGELLGLCRSDIDLLEKTVKVDRLEVMSTNGKGVSAARRTNAGLRTKIILQRIILTK